MSLPESAPEALAPITATPSARMPASETSKGVLAALFAYLLWSFLPLLFHALDAVGSVLIVAERTLWSLVLLAVILAFVGGFGEVRTLFSDRRRLLGTLLSAVLLAANWLLYVWAVETGQVLEASFGYFINPLVNVLMGMILLGERQNRLQTISILIAVVAIGIQAVGLGSIPFIALGLALSFDFYGYFRKTAQLGPASGLFAETLLIAPAALAYVVYDIATKGVGVHADPTLMALLSFALIWLSLAVFSYDSFRRRGRGAAA